MESPRQLKVGTKEKLEKQAQRSEKTQDEIVTGNLQKRSLSILVEQKLILSRRRRWKKMHLEK